MIAEFALLCRLGKIFCPKNAIDVIFALFNPISSR